MHTLGVHVDACDVDESSDVRRKELVRGMGVCDGQNGMRQIFCDGNRDNANGIGDGLGADRKRGIRRTRPTSKSVHNALPFFEAHRARTRRQLLRRPVKVFSNACISCLSSKCRLPGHHTARLGQLHYMDLLLFVAVRATEVAVEFVVPDNDHHAHAKGLYRMEEELIPLSIDPAHCIDHYTTRELVL